MRNFNMERLQIVAVTISRNRRVMEECFLWAATRNVFGKPLIDQPVIQQKLADMVSHLESCESWLERVAYQFQTFPASRTAEIGGTIALLKFRTTRMSHVVADHSCQIFGGRAITRTGMGKLVSRNQKSFKIYAIGGGSEEIMCSLGVRQAMKSFPRGARL